MQSLLGLIGVESWLYREQPARLYTLHLDHGQTPLPDAPVFHRQARGDSVALTQIWLGCPGMGELLTEFGLPARLPIIVHGTELSRIPNS